MMKRIVISAFLITAAACAGHEQGDLGTIAQEASASVWHSKWNGGNAGASFGDQFAGGYLDVWEGGGYASLSYSTYSVDPTSEVCVTETFPCDWEGCEPWEYTYCYYTRYSYEYGWGQIPATDFAFRNSGVARVATTVASGSDFWAWRCDVDYNSPEASVCTESAGGTIDVTWARDGLSSSFHSGVDHSDWGTYSFRTAGQWRTWSASANGSLIGLAFSNGWASMSSNKGVSISKDVVRIK